MAIEDVKYTVLQIVNEVQRKLALDATSSLTSNKLSIEIVDHINDVVDDLSDFGNWAETLTSANITPVSGQQDYSIPTSAVVKNIGDIFYTGRSGPMQNITVQEMRIRTSSNGTPSQFSVFGVDSAGNPNIRVRPVPINIGSSVFSINYYYKPPRYTTSDAGVYVPFPARVMVLGTLARVLLNESDGSPTDKYTATYNLYLQARKESFNRFKSDTGYSISFVPSNFGRRR